MPQPLTIQALEGNKLVIGGRIYKVERDEKPPNMLDSDFIREPKWRGGGEGWVWPLQGPSRSRWILKASMTPCMERMQRIQFLVALHLYDSPLRIFEACPQQAVSGRVNLMFDEVNRAFEPLDLQGYLARYIEGKTFDELLQGEDWHPKWEERQRLAVQLCCGIRALEAIGIAHTDLASQNIMIVQAPNRPPELRLIDFDGIYYPSLPTIPLTEEGGRKFGSDGYTHFSYARRDEHTVVRTDRVAMAVLVYELMVLRSTDLESLKRTTLFEQLHLNEREVEIPRRIKNRWPEGAELVRQALTCADPDAPAHQGGPPSPMDWLEILKRAAPAPSLPEAPSETPSTHYRETRRKPEVTYSAHCIVTDTDSGESWEIELDLRGSFKEAHIWLGWLTYERMSGATIRLCGQLPQEYRNEEQVEYFVSVGRNYHRHHKLDEQYDDSCDITVTDGDHVEVGVFNLDFIVEANDHST
ncbi:MAG: hypothetical protein U1A78_37930 [Polyangia bacterium]